MIATGAADRSSTLPGQFSLPSPPRLPSALRRIHDSSIEDDEDMYMFDDDAFYFGDEDFRAA